MTGNEQPPEWTPMGPAPDGQPTRPLAIIGVLLAVLLIAGGGAAAAVILTSDGDDDDQGSSAQNSAVTLTDWCDRMNELAESEENEFEEDPARAAELMRAVGVPEDMPDEVLRGRDVIIDIADEATDGDEAEQIYNELDEEETSDVEAFIAYYTGNCLDEEITDVPTEPPSTTSTDLPSDLVTGLPSDLPTELVTEFSTDLESYLPSDWESYLPSDWESYLPSDLATLLPSQ